MCEKLIHEGKVFADDTPSEQMADDRTGLRPSKCRTNTCVAMRNMRLRCLFPGVDGKCNHPSFFFFFLALCSLP
jgi:hypothetical protein